MIKKILVCDADSIRNFVSPQTYVRFVTQGQWKEYNLVEVKKMNTT